MINQNELRIGNWVSIDKQETLDLHKYIEVESIYKDGINAYYDCADESTIPDKYCSEISGIGLTPDVLSIIGFKLSQSKPYELYTNNSGWAIRIDCKDYELRPHIVPCVFSNFKYLHQLQNLFFCLTGEELTYTP